MCTPVKIMLVRINDKKIDVKPETETEIRVASNILQSNAIYSKRDPAILVETGGVKMLFGTTRQRESMLRMHLGGVSLLVQAKHLEVPVPNHPTKLMPFMDYMQLALQGEIKIAIAG